MVVVAGAGAKVILPETLSAESITLPVPGGPPSYMAAAITETVFP